MTSPKLDRLAASTRTEAEAMGERKGVPKSDEWRWRVCSVCGVKIPTRKPWMYSCPRDDCPIM